MSDPHVYTVGWICALSTEFVAAQAFLDDSHPPPENLPPSDNNTYKLGRIGHHNVVIAVLPNGEYGLSPATGVAKDLLRSFPNIRIGLMVGIGGGAPSAKHDIRLGDVVVAVSSGQGAILQYDFRKAIQGVEFKELGYLNQAPILLRTAVNSLKAEYALDLEGNRIQRAIDSALAKRPRLRRNYERPDESSDRLYQSIVAHPHPAESEADCSIICGNDPSSLVERRERDEDEDNPAIHYGLIASANTLMKDALIRDDLITRKNVLCFEMEAAGLMNHFPCLVIRGICDYSDSHKNKAWQGYAAMAAAAYAKDLLSQIASSRIEGERKISEAVFGMYYKSKQRRQNILTLIGPS
jgi:nucleoside phosphorylase